MLYLYQSKYTTILFLASLLLFYPLKSTAQPSDFARDGGTGSSADVSHESAATPSPELRGDLLMARGNYAAALDAYQQVSPRSAVTWNKLGIAYHHLFAMDEALEDYKTAIALDAHYAGAYNNLGAVYHSRREFSLAERSYKLAIKYDPRAAVTYCNLGTTYFAERKYKLGLKAYERAMQLDPSVFNASRSNKVEEGSSRTERMEIAFSLAEVYASSGQTEQALESLRRALSIGFNDRKRLMGDKQLAALRTTPAFQQLIAESRLE